MNQTDPHWLLRIGITNFDQFTLPMLAEGCQGNDLGGEAGACHSFVIVLENGKDTIGTQFVPAV